jgi:folylpolyglutamate synthase
LDENVRKAEREEVLALTTQREFVDAWAELVPSFPKENSHVLGTIQEAVDFVGSLYSTGDETDVLVIGSLHLVGGLISVAKLEDRVFS